LIAPPRPNINLAIDKFLRQREVIPVGHALGPVALFVRVIVEIEQASLFNVRAVNAQRAARLLKESARRGG
jgi:hypothetical protein